MIVEILYYNDGYRAVAFTLISILLVYCVRNKRPMTKLLSYGIYLMIVTAWFAWLFYMVLYVTKSPNLVILVWELKWIGYFLAITIIQHFIYKIFGKGKDMGLLILNALVAFVLCGIAFSYIK